MLAIFGQYVVNLKHIYDDHVNTDMSYKKFRELCEKCWGNGNYGFLVTDKDRALNIERFRNGSDKFLINIGDLG